MNRKNSLNFKGAFLLIGILSFSNTNASLIGQGVFDVGTSVNISDCDDLLCNSFSFAPIFNIRDAGPGYSDPFGFVTFSTSTLGSTSTINSGAKFDLAVAALTDGINTTNGFKLITGPSSSASESAKFSGIGITNGFDFSGNSIESLVFEVSKYRSSASSAGKRSISAEGILSVYGAPTTDVPSIIDLGNSFTVYASQNATIDASTENNGTFINLGDLTNNGNITNSRYQSGGGTFRNEGTFTNNDTLTNTGWLPNFGIINNTTTGFIIDPTGKLDNSGIVNNMVGAKITSNGSIVNNSGGSLTNTYNNQGTIDSNYRFTNASEFINDGTINNNGHYFLNRYDGTFVNNGNLTNSYNITNGGSFVVTSNGTVFNDNGADDALFINDGGSVDIKAGGSWSGNGTYKQLGGSLIVNGEMDHTIDIQAGTLSGTGTINGDVILGIDAALAPGNSPGKLIINGDLIIEDGSVLQLEIGDQLEIKGDLIIEDNAKVEILLGDLDVSSIDLGDFFDVLENINLPTNLILNAFTDQSASGSTPVNKEISVNYSGYNPWVSYELMVQDDTLASSVSILKGLRQVPEPTTLAIFVLGMIGLASRRFKK